MPCGFDSQARRLEICDAMFEERLGGQSLGVVPVGVRRPAHEPASFDRVLDVRDSSLEEIGGVSVSVRGDRGLGGGDAHAHRLLVAAGHQQVVGEVDSPPVGSRLEDLGDARVELLPARRDDVLINRLAGEGVPEAVPAGRAIRLLEELVGDARLERERDRGFGLAGHRGERGDVEGEADRRGGREHLDLHRLQPFQTLQNRLAHRRGKTDLVHRLAVPALIGAKDVAVVDRVPQHLLQHEGIALAAVVNEVAELVAHLDLVEDAGDHCLHALSVERVDLHQLRLP